jgi:hypothetical protein
MMIWGLVTTVRPYGNAVAARSTKVPWNGAKVPPIHPGAHQPQTLLKGQREWKLC